MLIAGNWKMNRTASETAEFCSLLRRRVEGLAGSVDISVFPPFTSLAAAVSGLADTEVAVGAQNVHWATDGAFTGEVSAPMLRELGAYAAIVGH
jgi:triosephosphate isomerase